MGSWPHSVTGQQVRDCFEILGVDEHWSVTAFMEIRVLPHEVRLRRYLCGEDGKFYIDPTTGKPAVEDKTIPIDWSDYERRGT